MQKLKTRKGAAKRLKLTGKGKVKFRRSNRSHLLTDRAQKRKRHLRSNSLYKGSSTILTFIN